MTKRRDSRAGRSDDRLVELKNAPVAQLDRASGYEPEGREFESLQAHHIIKHLPLSGRSGICRRIVSDQMDRGLGDDSVLDKVSLSLHLVTRTGHSIPEEQPEQLIKLLLGFLRGATAT